MVPWLLQVLTNSFLIASQDNSHFSATFSISICHTSVSWECYLVSFMVMTVFPKRASILSVATVNFHAGFIILDALVLKIWIGMISVHRWWWAVEYVQSMVFFEKSESLLVGWCQCHYLLTLLLRHLHLCCLCLVEPRTLADSQRKLFCIVHYYLIDFLRYARQLTTSSNSERMFSPVWWTWSWLHRMSRRKASHSLVMK